MISLLNSLILSKYILCDKVWMIVGVDNGNKKEYMFILITVEIIGLIKILQLENYNVTYNK